MKRGKRGKIQSNYHVKKGLNDMSNNKGEPVLVCDYCGRRQTKSMMGRVAGVNKNICSSCYFLLVMDREDSKLPGIRLRRRFNCRKGIKNAPMS